MTITEDRNKTVSDSAGTDMRIERRRTQRDCSFQLFANVAFSVHARVYVCVFVWRPTALWHVRKGQEGSTSKTTQ